MKTVVIIICATFCLFECTTAASDYTNMKKSEALKYLKRYGYMERGNISEEKAFQEAMEDFQDMAGLEITGKLDDATKYMMNVPRCGMKDKMPNRGNRTKRYAFLGSKWNGKYITYKISKYSEKLQPSSVNYEIRRAFQVWSRYTGLTFNQRQNGAVTINIRFENRNHGDRDAFDGPGGTLAHATGPFNGGSYVHFDEAEAWTRNSYRGQNFFQTAVHEIGHALGLDHSNIRQAVMYPFSSPYNPSFNLHNDDIRGIQALYRR